MTTPTMPPEGAGSPEAASYKAMLDEVEGLVRDVAQPDLDLDALVAKVERGYAVIRILRSRLDQTKERIEKLRLELD